MKKRDKKTVPVSHAARVTSSVGEQKNLDGGGNPTSIDVALRTVVTIPTYVAAPMAAALALGSLMWG